MKCLYTESTPGIKESRLTSKKGVRNDVGIVIRIVGPSGEGTHTISRIWVLGSETEVLVVAVVVEGRPVAGLAADATDGSRRRSTVFHLV